MSVRAVVTLPERRACLLVRLLRTLYAGTRDEIPSGSMMRVEGEIRSGLHIEVSPINQAGRRITVSRFTEASAIGPDCAWDCRSMALLTMAYSVRSNERLYQALMRHWYAYHQRRGRRQIAAAGCELVVYAGGAK